MRRVKRNAMKVCLQLQWKKRRYVERLADGGLPNFPTIRGFSQRPRKRPLFQQFAIAFGTMQSNCSQMVVLASIFAVLVVSTQAIDLTRLYDHHNKRELVVGKLLFFLSPKMASLCMISNVWCFSEKTLGQVRQVLIQKMALRTFAPTIFLSARSASSALRNDFSSASASFLLFQPKGSFSSISF